MNTDIFTLQKDDLIEFASTLMDWSDTSSMAVEDDKGNLVGLVSSKQILKHFAQKGNSKKDTIVSDVMDKNPHTVTQQMKITEVIRLMKEHNRKMLPVLKGKELIGVISETNFVNMSKRLIQIMNKS